MGDGNRMAAARAPWKAFAASALALSLPLLFAFATWLLDRASIGVAADAYRSPYTVATNALPGLLACLAIFIATRRLLFSFLLGFLAQSAVYTASSIKLEVLQVPVTLEDIHFLTGIDRGGIAVFSAYIDGGAAAWAFVVAGLGVLALVAWFETPWFRHAGPTRLLLLALAASATASLVSAGWPWTRIHDLDATTPTRFTTMPTVLHSGLMSSLVHTHLERKTRVFAIDDRALREAARRLDEDPGAPVGDHARPLAGQHPDIVVVLSESFFDPRILKRIDALEDPIPNVRTWLDSGYGGQMAVPAYAGGTIRTEFEILTGMPVQAFPGAGFPYMDLDVRRAPSLPGILAREAGYRTVAIHGHQGSFYNRASVYKPLGFQKFLTSRDFRPDGHKDGLWYSDQSMTDLLVGELEAGEAPLFAFAISMQNHGPYNQARTLRHPDAWEALTLPDGISAESAIELRNLLYHLGSADTQFARLLGVLQRRERPYMLLFFGDHLPGLKSTYPELGFVDGKSPRTQKPSWVLIRGQGTTTWPADRDIGFPWQLPAELVWEAGIDNAYFDFSRRAGAALGPDYAKKPGSPLAKGLTAAARANLKGELEARLP